jgi:hypothetical protein
VRLVDGRRHRLARDPDDNGGVVPEFHAVRLVHPATGEENDPVDMTAADRPHHRLDDSTKRCHHHPSLSLQQPLPQPAPYRRTPPSVTSVNAR